MPAEIFREAGFRTAGIWRNGWIGPDFGFDQGFQTYTQPKPTARNRGARRERPNIAALLGTDADLVVSARSFFRSFADEQWFLYLHMMDVHQYVYTPDEALFGNSYLDNYDNSIRWVDRLIGDVESSVQISGVKHCAPNPSSSLEWPCGGWKFGWELSSFQSRPPVPCASVARRDPALRFPHPPGQCGSA